MVNSSSKPSDVLKALVVVANEMIQDPEKKGWEILEIKDKSIIMKRTQDFNSKLQLGLLDGIVRKTGVSGVKVDYVKEVELGATHDEYLITWH